MNELHAARNRHIVVSIPRLALVWAVPKLQLAEGSLGGIDGNDGADNGSCDSMC